MPTDGQIRMLRDGRQYESSIVEESAMWPEMDAAIRRALIRCFPRDADHFSKTRQWNGHLIEYSVMRSRHNAHTDGTYEVFALVQVILRTIQIGNVNFMIAGIQNVCVVPEERGRGHCVELLELAMHAANQPPRAADHWMQFGILFPGVVRPYEKAGWKLIPNGGGAMFFPLGTKEWPSGKINWQGKIW